jgi:hypothetical protein
LKKRSGYNYFTKIDISMQYYAFELDDASKDLCTICTPGFGNYRYWLTPRGLKPWKKKIDAILRLLAPTTVKQLRSFIGAVTFYHDMFQKRSHILAPPTHQVGQKTLKWTPECDIAFKAAKAMITKDAFLSYSYHNQPFHIYCDTSELQLGAAIIQNGRAVAFNSRKLTETQ